MWSGNETREEIKLGEVEVAGQGIERELYDSSVW